MKRDLPSVHQWPPDYFTIPDKFEGKPYDHPLAWICTMGCSWYKTGGCTMCNFGSIDVKTIPDYARDQTREIIRRVHTELGEKPNLDLLVLGSSFDTAEIPTESMLAMFTEATRFPWIRYITTEARPDHLSHAKLEGVKKLLYPILFGVGFGLESANPLIRELCVNKGIKEGDSSAAIQLMNQLDIQSQVHILLKPIFVSEAEAIDDALSTTKSAILYGGRRIVLMVNSVKRHNVQHSLYQAGMYRPPWLWSIREALNRIKDETANIDIINVYGFKSGVEIVRTAHNCGKCDEEFLFALDHFNYTADLSRLNDISCPCEYDWRTALEQKNDSLVKRIRAGCLYLGHNVIGDAFSEEMLDPRLRL